MMEPALLAVQLLEDGAVAPARQTPGSVGYDLRACDDGVVIRAGGGYGLVNTGVAIRVPDGTYGRIAPRSGLAVRGVHVGAGVIDADYRGPVKVLLFNFNPDVDLVVQRGDRIAQLVLEVARTPDVDVVDDLGGSTARGAAGFGSTGTA